LLILSGLALFSIVIVVAAAEFPLSAVETIASLLFFALALYSHQLKLKGQYQLLQVN
jgi:hypothetical protein